MAIAADGQTLATCSLGDGEVKLWDLAARRERTSLKADLGNSISLAFAPDGKTLAVAHWGRDAKGARADGGIVLWDVATGKEYGRFKEATPRTVSRVAFAPDGRTVAASESWTEGEKGRNRSRLVLWDVGSGKVRQTLAEESAAGLTFSPDGKSLAGTVYSVAAGVLDSKVCRWDATTGQELTALARPSGLKAPSNSLAFSPDGGTLAGADYEGHVVVWDVTKGNVRAVLSRGDRRRVMALAFAPDGKTLAAAVGNPLGQRAHEAGLVVLWDVAARRQRAVLTGHTSEVYAVAFTPDGRTLVSGGMDRTVRLWDMTRVPPTAGTADER